MGEIFCLNDQDVEALKDFNVYTEQNRFAQALKTLHKDSRDKHEYAHWLSVEGLVKISPQSTKPAHVQYKTFPYCPGYRDILKTLVILTSCLKMDDLVHLGISDVYVHTLMKDRISAAAFDTTQGYLQNLNRLLLQLNSELEIKEQEQLRLWQSGVPISQNGELI